VTRVKGHKVKYSNRNNFVADCSILLKLGTKVYHVTGDILKCSRSKVQVIAWSKAKYQQ